MEEHNSKVLAIAASIKSFHSQNQKFRIFHGTTNSTRNQAFRDKKNIVDTSQLTKVLGIDVEKQIALVEANVPMDRLVEATLAYNLIPPVIADLPGITVGGGYSGTTGESSSFKYGFFDRTVARLEMVLGTGEVGHLSETERPDLFRGAAGSLGTLGVVTMLEIRLVKATKFVETTYHPVASVQEAVERCREETSGERYESNDYVDGILFSKTFGAVITGRRVDENNEGLPIVRFSGRKDDWFYMHVEQRLKESGGKPVKVLIPLPEYLFRYDRGCFWTGKSVFTMTSWLPFNRTTRALLDAFLHTRMLYAALHSQPINIQILHDCGVPYPAATEFIDWAADCTGIWPIWICPLKQSPRPTLHPHTRDLDSDPPILNVGIWGNARENSIEGYLEENNQLEAKLRSIGGLKWMYSPQWAEGKYPLSVISTKELANTKSYQRRSFTSSSIELGTTPYAPDSARRPFQQFMIRRVQTRMTSRERLISSLGEIYGRCSFRA